MKKLLILLVLFYSCQKSYYQCELNGTGGIVFHNKSADTISLHVDSVFVGHVLPGKASRIDGLKAGKRWVTVEDIYNYPVKVKSCDRTLTTIYQYHVNVIRECN